MAAAVLGAIAGGMLVFPTSASAAPIAAPADFNHDGYGDMVVPAPGATVNGKPGAGAVIVLYGSKTGISAPKRLTITQDTVNVPDSAEAYDHFGASTAFADLDNDGYSDLVVGAPYEDLDTTRDAGLVTVLWGGPKGLSAGSYLPTGKTFGARVGLDVAAVAGTSKPEVLTTWYAGFMDVTGTFKRTGAALKVTPNDSLPSLVGVALANVVGDKTPDWIITTARLGGHTGGFTYINPWGNSQELPADGTTTATGDINGDGFNDLVIGDPDEPEGTTDGHRGGEITVWYGSAAGLAATPVRLNENSASVPGTSVTYDGFGTAVVVSDLNGDGLGDIVVGSPYSGQPGKVRGGAVVVIPGTRTGTPGAGSYLLTQETAGVAGDSQISDQFGTTLAAGDLNRDGHPELIVGAAGQDGTRGGVWVLPGTASRPTGTGSVLLSAAALAQTGFPQIGGVQPL